MLYDEMSISHEVTPLTMAVLSIEGEKGMRKTVVLERSGEYHVDVPPTKVIDEACRFYGSSLRGRLEGTRDISRITHKAPIVIDPSLGMYFFPTASPSNRDCSWIAHSHVQEINPYGKKETEIVFKNGQTIVVPVSYGSMLNQLQRTAQFRFSLDTRMKQLHNVLERKRNE